MSEIQIIKRSSPAVISICGKQSYDESIQYRHSLFTIIVQEVDCTLLHSCLTGELVKVKNERESIQYLVENWFMVPVGYDEKKSLSQIKNLLRCLGKQRKTRYKTFEIITTTLCNARCFYCYEENFKHMTMNERTICQVVDFIYDHCADNTVKLKWYGGEPLMNVKAIDGICKALKEKGIEFKSSMISNGLLFSELMIKNAYEIWNLSNVRITIDGTEDSYNKIKNYKKIKGNAYKKLLMNIDSLLAVGIPVTIRLNIEENNIIDSKELLSRLCDKFQKNNLVDFMLRPLNNTDKNGNIESKGTKRDDIYSQISSMKVKLFEDGYDVNCGKLTGMTFFSCIADSGTYIAIKPNGELVYCSTDFDKKSYGTIYDKFDIYPCPDLSQNLFEKGDICNDCPLLPICSPSKLCPSCLKPICSQAQKSYNIMDIKLTMRKMYRKQYKK